MPEPKTHGDGRMNGSTYWIATRDGYLPKLLESETLARDLARSGWTVVRVVKTEPLDA